MKKEMRLTTAVIKNLLDKLSKPASKSDKADEFNLYLKKTLSELLAFDNTFIEAKKNKKAIELDTTLKRKAVPLENTKQPAKRKRAPAFCIHCTKMFSDQTSLRRHLESQTACPVLHPIEKPVAYANVIQECNYNNEEEIYDIL